MGEMMDDQDEENEAFFSHHQLQDSNQNEDQEMDIERFNEKKKDSDEVDEESDPND